MLAKHGKPSHFNLVHDISIDVTLHSWWGQEAGFLYNVQRCWLQQYWRWPWSEVGRSLAQSGVDDYNNSISKLTEEMMEELRQNINDSLDIIHGYGHCFADQFSKLFNTFAVLHYYYTHKENSVVVFLPRCHNHYIYMLENRARNDRVQIFKLEIRASSKLHPR